MIWFYNSVNLLYELSNCDFVYLAGPFSVYSTIDWRKEFLNKITLRYKYDFFIPNYWSESWTFEENSNIDNSIRLSQYEIYSLERSLLKKAWRTVFWFDKSENSISKYSDIEFGNFIHPVKMLCGSPIDAKDIDYLKYIWEIEHEKYWYNDMTKLVDILCRDYNVIKNTHGLCVKEN